MLPVRIEEILIDPERQRKYFDMAKVLELASSIQSLGLLQPLVLADRHLVAGERRLRACTHLARLGVSIRHNGETLAPGFLPTISVNDSSEIGLFEAQLDENIKRADLTWQEKAAAVEQLHRLRAKSNPTQSINDTAQELTGNRTGGYSASIEASVIVAKHLEDKEVSSAPTLKDALKILVKREERQKRVALGEKINVIHLSDQHVLHHADFRRVELPPGSVDVVLTDPPYGMAADSFKDGGDPGAVLHKYDDVAGPDWEDLMNFLYDWSWRVTKESAHVYMFCDIDQFDRHRAGFTRAGFRVFRTPLVWVKSHASSRRVPWPDSGPRRGYELCLYAVKGGKRVVSIKSDVLGPYTTDANLGHAAQKPVELYTELLARSISPGDCVVDPFCGTGTIFPAAHSCKVRAIGCEIDPGFASIAADRLAKLKEQV